MLKANRNLHVVNTGDAQVPQIVLYGNGNVQLPLTLFGRYLRERYASNTCRVYINTVVAFFEWSIGSVNADDRFWKANIDDARQQIVTYLALQFSCKLKNHRSGVRLVEPTHGNVTAISQFLAGVHAFYNAMILEKQYNHENPLKNWIPTAKNQSPSKSSPFPVMPQLSGVAEPISKKRLTDSFFVIINDQWTPRVIDDPTFPSQVFEAGEQFNWGLREQIIVRMLFETGARISEVCGLTVGDWGAKGFLDASTAFNKGSNGRRVKFLRWSSSTTKLLRRYFDNERILVDKENQGLSSYMQSYRLNSSPLYSVPLFITRYGTTVSANSFRDLYWRPALKQANVRAHIHQARHWYVTMAIREIYEETVDRSDVERRTKELIQYMNWRSGKSTLDAYEHYFNQQRHGEIQDKLHRKLDDHLKMPIETSPNNVSSITVRQPDPDLDFLLRMGGQIDG